MRAYGLRLSDLFEKKEEAMDFLHQVLNEAARRVGFHPGGAVTSMQMSVLPDQSLSLTISEQSKEQFDQMLADLQKKLGVVLTGKMRKELAKLSDEERIERLKEYALHLIREGESEAAPDAGESRDDQADAGDAQETAFGTDGSEDGPEGAEAQGSAHGRGNEQDAAEQVPEEQLHDREFLFEFESFADVLHCARFLAGQPVYKEHGVQAELYTDGGEPPVYWMILVKPEGDDSGFARAVLSLNEYGRMLSSQQGVLAHIREQERCIQREQTIEMLAGI